MSTTLRRTLIVALLAAGVTAGVWYLARPRPAEVVVREVDRGDVEATVANTRAGTVRAHKRSRLSAATGGTVAVLSVEEGDRVEAGQVLLELWNDDLKAELRLANEQVARARSLAEEACHRAGLAEREAKRLSELSADDVAVDALDRAESEALATASARRAAAAQVRVQEARAASIAALLEKTLLRAPFAGVVAEVNAEIGEYVTPSPPGIPTPPAVDLIDDRSPYVLAPIDEVDAAAVAVGMEARVTLDAFPGRVFGGRVRRIAPYVLDREKQARTVDVEVEFAEDRSNAGLLAGYSADAEVVLQVRSDVVRVPTEAVRAGDRVWTVDTNGILRERSLELGVSNWTHTEVLDGVTEGELVVVSLDEGKIEPGAAVRAVRSPQDGR